MGFEKIDARQQPCDLFCCYLFYVFFLFRPRKLRFFKAFVPQSEAALIPVQQFQYVPGLTAENKVSFFKRIQLRF